jgi:hypothetical protein
MADTFFCRICGGGDPSPVPFLCSRCVSPDSITVTCSRCWKRYSLEPGSGDADKIAEDLRMSIGPGTAIESSGCKHCAGPDARIRMKGYRIKPYDA